MATAVATRTAGAPDHGRNRIAFELLEHPRTLLDYGCGNGQFASRVAQSLGMTVDACDINSASVARAAGEPGVRAHLIAADSPRLPIESGRFEAVTCCDVIEHMDEDLRRTALAEIHRVLADEGALILTTPHTGLFSFADPENFKFQFPRLHRTVFRALKGSRRYEHRYGGGNRCGDEDRGENEDAGGTRDAGEGGGEGGRFGNYSGESTQRHRHFATDELTSILGQAGFEVETVRYYTLIYPFARIALWTAQGIQYRLAPKSRIADRACRQLVRLCWRLYRWDADLECGRASCSIAVRARKRSGISTAEA